MENVPEVREEERKGVVGVLVVVVVISGIDAGLSE